MKRKVYVKQMKMLKDKTKLHDKDQDKEPAVSPLNQDTSTTSSLPTGLTSAAVSSTPKWPAITSSTHSNSGPLPTVDVLMKSSTLRAFQLRQHQESHVDNERPVSNTDLNSVHGHSFKHDIPPSTSSLPSPSPYTGNQEDLNNTHHVERWVKDCSNSEHIPNILPKLGHTSYPVESPGVYNVNLDRADLHTNENGTNSGVSSPPPVFHQLQASRLNDKPVNIEMHDNTNGYSSEQERNNSVGHDRGPHDQYGIMGIGSDVTPHHNHHHHNHHHQCAQDAQHYTHDNASEEHFHESHGQVRAWEQENYRYVDFTWRHSMDTADESESMYTDMRSSDEESNYDDSNNALDESVDLSNKSTPSRPANKSGRRRRKRVQTPVQRSAANMRERRRMCHLNVAFDYLKEHLPNVKDKKKLSRIQTLKAAIYYIHLLQDSLSVH